MPDEQPIPAESLLATPEPAQPTPSSVAFELLPHEEPTVMLDVHPPHHTVNTWRDFFIHIATIVIGLLIAVGLEQTVEAIHHRNLAGEAHENIQREIEDNIGIVHLKS